jgi:hypothetical protein
MLIKIRTYSYKNKYYKDEYSDYCKKSTLDSIYNLTSKYSLERTIKIINPFDDDGNNNNVKLLVYGFAVMMFSVSAYFSK